MTLILLNKIPHPCPPHNSHCQDAVTNLSIDSWIGLMIIIAVIYGCVIIKKNYEYNRQT
jgi:predicted membrane GTPase involved in stress response